MQTIVIVDDNQVVGSIYRSKLRAEGFIAEVAVTGETGLEMIRRVLPDLVLLDLMLPKMSGVDVLRTIRSEPELGAIPVIVFSNSYDDRLVQDAWAAGATQVLSKATHSPKQVVAAVNAVLAVRPPRPQPTAEAAIAPDTSPSVDGWASGQSGGPAADVPSVASATRRVLYLAEQRDTRLLVTVLLEEASHRVTAVNSPGDVIALAQSTAFDVFLLRDSETDSSVLALSRQLRALKPATPVIVFSLGASSFRREDALRAGAAAFVSDPLDVLKISGIVSNVIRQAV